MGISKKELFCDYYMDEIGEIMAAYNELHRYDKEDEPAEEIDGASFFGF